jgi:two-component system, NtrC family, sensor histidine kinase HydH
MAHEIKNPLAALWGAAQLLEGKTEGDKENVKIIKEEMKRLTGVLDSWKDFSGEIRLSAARADVAALIEDAVKLARIQFSGVEFKVTAFKGEAVIDAEKIKQVLLNLVINACQAMEKITAPAVAINARLSGGALEIRIKDNGPGIPASILEKIKQPLFTTKPKGSGLGLAICERIVKAHNGELIIYSDGKSFTEAVVLIPLEG